MCGFCEGRWQRWYVIWVLSEFFQQQKKNDLTEKMFFFSAVFLPFLVCGGDTGGALVAFDSVTKVPTQLGIVSWGNGCANKGYPDVYARTLAVREWIHEKTGI